MDHRPTVYVIDSDQSACQSVRELVSTMNLQCEVRSSGREFLDTLDPSRPGCVVMEVRVPGISGLQLQSHLNQNGIELPLIFLTARADVSIAVEAMRLGAVHFFEKPFRVHEMWTAIHEAIELDQDRRRARAWQQQLDQRTAALTPREKQVLEFLGHGKSNRDIAAELHVCVRTVEMHRARLMKKLKLTSRNELVDLAILVSAKEPEDPDSGF